MPGFGVDERLLDDAAPALRSARFVLGGAGTGKSTVCAAISAATGIPVIDMDARLYGSWHGRFDPTRHPAASAWSGAPDPLGWQLALGADGYLAFQAALAAEALDLLAQELRAGAAAGPVLVDGGLGSVEVPAQVVSSAAIVCLTLPVDARAGVWLAPDRREMLDMVAAVKGIDDPLGRFLEIDGRLTAALEAEARASGIAVVARGPDMEVATLARTVAAALALR
jgi:hypothetical protein